MATVLCIDDSAEGLRIRKLLLEAKGYSAVLASGGEEGLRVAQEQPVDLVILDYKMAPMDGEEVARRLRSTNPSIPIVMLSGFEVPQQARDLVDSFVTKGQPAETLLTEIERLVGEAHAKKAPAHDREWKIAQSKGLVESSRELVERNRRRKG